MYIQPLKYEFSPLISAFGSTTVRGYGFGASIATPTPTPTPAPTPTPTPTPSPTPCPRSYYGAFYNDGGYSVISYACDYYFYSSFYSDVCTGQLYWENSYPFTGWLNQYGTGQMSYYSNGYLQYYLACPVPTPTPTPIPVSLVIGNVYPEYGGRYIGFYSYIGNNLIDSGTSYEVPYIQWKVNGTHTSGADNYYDGYSNTYNNYDSQHPAFQYAGDLSKDGFYDWYIASPEELLSHLHQYKNAGSDSLYYNHYWASMEYTDSGRTDVAWNWLPHENRWSMAFKTSTRAARPIRRF